MIIKKVFVLFEIFYLVESNTIFLPNLPLGEYRTVFERVYPCISTNRFQTNLYFSKRTSNITEIKGNFTMLKPLDDSYTFDVNFASWSLTGGWKPNAMVYTAKNACSNMKIFYGSAWNSLKEKFNFSSYNCPISPGTYISSGVDLKEIEHHNFPKVYFYGRYKLTMKIKDVKNNVHGCCVFELSLIRPWEKPI